MHLYMHSKQKKSHAWFHDPLKILVKMFGERTQSCISSEERTQSRIFTETFDSICCYS